MSGLETYVKSSLTEPIEIRKSKMTPAQAGGIEVKGWKNLVREAQTEKVKEELQAQPMTVEVRVRE